MPEPDNRLDLVFQRIVDVPRDRIWMAWTTPGLLKKWFCPAPWSVAESEIDLRPGGVFRTVMRSPEGDEFPSSGCFLEVRPEERLVWTSALTAGYRPAPAPPSGEGFVFTATLSLEPHGAGTRYRALVAHGDEDSRRRHEALGFHEGWGKALDQLVELTATLHTASTQLCP